jgi:hypothetical protein
MILAEGGEEGCSRDSLVEAVAAVVVEAVAAVPDAVAVAGRVAWEVPRRPDLAATACAPIAVTKRLIRWDKHAIR